MAREKIRNGGKLECDIEGCASYFVTYSFVRLTRAQALAIGWQRLSGRKISGGEPGVVLALGKVDVCPECAARGLPPFVPAPKEPKKRKRKARAGQPEQQVSA